MPSGPTVVLGGWSFLVSELPLYWILKKPRAASSVALEVNPNP